MKALIAVLIISILSIGGYFYVPHKLKMSASFAASDYCGESTPIFYRQDVPIDGKAVFVCNHQDYTITFIGKEIKPFYWERGDKL